MGGYPWRQSDERAKWEELAIQARWPVSIAQKALQGWIVRNNDLLTQTERDLLSLLARMDHHERNTIGFQSARRLLTEELTS